MSRVLLFVILCIFLLQSCIQQDTVSYKAQFKSDTTTIGNFIGNNKIQAIKMNAGFWYSIDTLTNLVYPALSDEVTISYKVKWIKSSSQMEADLDTVGHSKFTNEVLSTAISGLQQGLILFPTGSYGRLYLPSGLAFGVSGHYDKAHDTTHVNIPPNANLLYEIKLISVKGTRLSTDIATIDSYLQSKGIGALHDGSGIRYKIDTVAQTSPKKMPVEGDSIKVIYTENLLTTDTSKVYTKKFAWKDQVTGWRIMLHQYATEGSKIAMYTPSGYAYGSSVKGLIPANSNIIYVVTLTEVIHH